MSQLKPLRQFMALLMAVVLITPACKDPELIGIEVLPEDEGYPVAWEDSFTVVVSTVLGDSVPTSNTPSNVYLFGEMNDPEFGTTKSELFTQFRLSAVPQVFADQPEIDSVVLNLAYYGSYGNVNKFSGGIQKVGVYRLENEIFNDSTYYSNGSTTTYGTVPLAQVSFRPDLTSTIVAGEDVLPPSLRIRLDSAFGQEILSAPEASLASHSEFLKLFKGLAIVPENTGLAPGEGAILYFDMISGATRLEVYYSNNSEDSLRYLLPINAASASHARFSHQHPMGITSILGDIEAGKDRLYVQSMQGLKIKVEIPHLKKLKALGHVVINRAEIVVPVADVEVSRYGVPTYLETVQADSAGRSLTINDYQTISGVSLYEGQYRSSTNGYVLNVARHLQSILNQSEGEKDYGLFIFNSGNAVNARRGIFNGPGHPTRPLHLRLTYTIIQ